MKARGLVRLVRGVWAGWAAALLLAACDSGPTGLAVPASIEVPATAAPASCRGDGRWRCPDPEPVQPPEPETMDSMWVHPLHARWEVGESMPYWLVGWYGGQPWGCAATETEFVGRVQLNRNWLYGSVEQVWTPADIREPEVGGDIVIPDMALCEAHVEFEDAAAIEWTPLSFIGSVSAWLREIFS